MVFSEEIQSFIKNESWTFAKTYALTWPHEYIVQEKVDDDLFLKLAEHIDIFGYEEYFYRKENDIFRS